MNAQVDTTPQLAALKQTMDQIVSRIQASAVFGQPVEHENTVVIPCAEIVVGVGFGGGGGFAPAKEASEQKASGSGVGGGGGGRGRPVAAIIITPHGVEIKPIPDVKSLAFVALATAGLVTLTVLRITRLSRNRNR
jgi:uncharacterized spore protein YtfJ